MEIFWCRCVLLIARILHLVLFVLCNMRFISLLCMRVTMFVLYIIYMCVSLCVLCIVYVAYTTYPTIHCIRENIAPAIQNEWRDILLEYKLKMCLPHTSRSSMNMFSFYFVSKEEAKTNDSFYSCADKHFASIYLIWIFGLAFEWQLFSSVFMFYFVGGCAMHAKLHRHFTSFSFVLT